VVNEEAVALVGRMRPALVWGWTRYPSCSSAAISERTVADDTETPAALATWPEPTGWAVPMYSVTTASKDGGLPLVELLVGLVVGGFAVVCGAGHSSSRGLALDSTSASPSPPDGQSSRRRAEMNASWGTSTRPMFFMRFFPSFWRSKSLRLRVMSPP